MNDDIIVAEPSGDLAEAILADKPKAKRGFACMSLEQRTEIARKGGANVKAHRRAFSRNSELATFAGRKGGIATAAKKKAPIP